MLNTTGTTSTFYGIERNEKENKEKTYQVNKEDKSKEREKKEE